MTQADQVAAALDKIRERTEAPVARVTSLPITHPGVRGLMESAADVPRLLAAVDRVLAVHRRTPGHDGKDRCAWCRTSSGVRELWPCGEYQAIAAELLGEVPDGDDS